MTVPCLKRFLQGNDHSVCCDKDLLKKDTIEGHP